MKKAAITLWYLALMSVAPVAFAAVSNTSPAAKACDDPKGFCDCDCAPEQYGYTDGNCVEVLIDNCIECVTFGEYDCGDD